MQTPSPRAADPVIRPGETPEQAASRLGLPCESVPTRHGGVAVAGRLARAQIVATHRHILRTMREHEERRAA